MASEGFVLEEKPVFDWNNVPVGRVASTLRDPKSGTASRLVVRLTPEAQSELGTKEPTVELPAGLVFGMRRDAVTLDRSLHEIRRTDLHLSLVKK